MDREPATTTRQRVGLGIAGVLSVLNIVSVFQPTPEGETGPPLVVLVIGAALGLVGIVGAVLAWRSGDRRTLRVVGGAVIVMALLALPAFFVDVPAGLKAAVGVTVLATILSCVLMLSTSRDSVEVAS